MGLTQSYRRLLIKTPEIGDWVTYCCEEDLLQVVDQEHLANILEDIDEDVCSPVSVWRTYEDALVELKDRVHP